MCSENQREANSRGSECDLSRARVEYAWRWFEYHAKQRISMFNFFLVASGLLATGYVDALKQSNGHLGGVLSLFGMVIAIVFTRLDQRNARLVYLGEDVLRRLEKESLFHDSFRGLDEQNRETTPGMLSREIDEPFPPCMKHSGLLPATEYIVALGFLLGTIRAFVFPFDV